MPGHHVMPVGGEQDGRGQQRAQGGRFAGRDIVLRPGERHPSPPAPPRWLVDPRAIELYLEAWGTPVSVLWAEHNADDVARLAELELLLEGGDRRSWIFSALATLRTNLWLLPKPMRAAGIRIEGADAERSAPAGASEKSSSRSRPTKRARRSRLEPAVARELERLRELDPLGADDDDGDGRDHDRRAAAEGTAS